MLKETGDKVLKGSFVTAGKGRMIAGAVGDAAEMGVIAATLGIDHATKTPLEEKLEILAGLISKFGYVMAILICSTLVIRGLLVGDLTGLEPRHCKPPAPVLHARGRDRRCRRARGAADERCTLALPCDAQDDPGQLPCPAPHCLRDHRVGDLDLHRQDRDAHEKPDGSGRGLRYSP